MEELKQQEQNQEIKQEQTKLETEPKKETKAEDPLEFYRHEIKRIAKERDAYKQKVKELESLKVIEQEYQTLKNEYETILKSLKEKEEAKKQELIEKIKDDKEAFELASKIDNLEALEKFVVLYTQKNKSVIVSNQPTVNGNTKIKSWDDYSSIELAKIKKENPELYKQLYKQKFAK